MPLAWGGSWGTSWGQSWGAEALGAVDLTATPTIGAFTSSATATVLVQATATPTIAAFTSVATIEVGGGRIFGVWPDDDRKRRRRLRGLEHIYKAIDAARKIEQPKPELVEAVDTVEEFFAAPEMDLTPVYLAIQVFVDLKVYDAKRALAEIERLIIERDEEEVEILLLH